MFSVGGASLRLGGQTVRVATGRIVLAGTPLGNPADASRRLCELLVEADVIAAEDTRRVRRLAHDLGLELTARVISNYEAVEQRRAEELVAQAAEGALVVVVTDAGMPTVSDPGYRIVVAAQQALVAVEVAPGPSAVTTALAVSGLPSDRFCFEGFLPRKAGELQRRLAGLADEPRTMVFFESPRRTAATLAAMREAFGSDRLAAVCRELTKTYEQVLRGDLSELADWADQHEVLGEITVVVAGASPRVEELSPAELVAKVAGLEAEGVDRKQAIATVAREAGVPKREVYNAVVAAKN